jgi:uncharacterized membrane protein YfcA
VPVGLVAQWLIQRHMPDYHGESARPLDVVGLVLFGAGAALLSWLLEVFGEHHLDATSGAILLLLALSLLAAYGLHAGRTEHPLLRLQLFRVRTFRVSVVGGFITRMGLGGLPFLLPLLYQLGLGLPAWESGLLTMPTAAAAMSMKLMASTIASSLQQMSMSFGLACGSLIAAWYLGDLPQDDRLAVSRALHHAFTTLGVLTAISWLSFWTLRREDGESVSRGAGPQVGEPTPEQPRGGRGTASDTQA